MGPWGFGRAGGSPTCRRQGITVLNWAVPAISEFLVLGVLPLVYLTLMYLTFKSQD